MATQNEKLLGAMASPGMPGQKSNLEAFEDNMRHWWAGNDKKIISLCGSHEMARKLLITAINVVQKTPKLLECNFNTFVSALLTSAELDLFPGAKQECAYVPKESKTGGWEVHFWPMYYGLVKHMYRSGEIKSISCQMVQEKDEFDFQEGSNPFVHFKRSLAEDRGKVIVGFCSIDLLEGGRIVEIVSLDYIDQVKKTAPGSKSDYSPWNVWPEAMERKTLLKRGYKWAPKSESCDRVIALDNAAERPDLQKPNILNLGSLIDQLLPNKQKPQAQISANSTGVEMPKMPQAEKVPVERGAR